jgi:pyrophosphatase PpaX
MNIHTILFDLDGTLIDTNQLITASFKHTFEQFQLEFTDEELIKFNGLPLIETFKNIDPIRADEMVETYREHNLKVHDDYVKPFPQVEETLKRLHTMGVKMGVVTTKMSPGAEMGLERVGIADYFDSVITLNQVTHAKPHPEPVIKTMKELHAEQESSLMVGDNSYDIEAGQRAGIKTAGVSWSQRGREHLLQYKPTYMLENMSDLIEIVGG